MTQADTAMVESASPASIVFGSQDTLSVTGLAGDATGTVTFTSGGAILCVATLPATQLPDIGHTRARFVPGHRDVLR